MLEQSLQRLREANYKITDARSAVLQVLHGDDGHLTSPEIVERVEKLDPSIGRASVFRTLDLLTQLLIIRPTYSDSRAMAYVLLECDGHHSHIVCTKCKKVIELDRCMLDGMLERLQSDYKVNLSGHLLELYGTCDACTA